MELLGRSLFTMVLVSDLLLRLNAFVWLAQRNVAGSANAETYDQLMENLGG